MSRRHPAHEPALAQAAGAEHHPARRRSSAAAAAAPWRRRAGRRRAGAARRAAAPARGWRRRRSCARKIARLLAPDGVVMHHAQRVVGLRHVDPRQRPPRAADQIEIARRRPRSARPIARDRASAIAARSRGSPPERSASRMTPSGRVGCRARRAVVEPHEFQRAAADIGQQAVRLGNAAQHALGRSSASSAPDRMRIGTSGMRALQRVDEVRRRCARRAPRRWPAPRTARRPSRARRRDSGASRSSPAPCRPR